MNRAYGQCTPSYELSADAVRFLFEMFYYPAFPVRAYAPVPLCAPHLVVAADAEALRNTTVSSVSSSSSSSAPPTPSAASSKEQQQQHRLHQRSVLAAAADRQRDAVRAAIAEARRRRLLTPTALGWLLAPLPPYLAVSFFRASIAKHVRTCAIPQQQQSQPQPQPTAAVTTVAAASTTVSLSLSASSSASTSSEHDTATSSSTTAAASASSASAFSLSTAAFSPAATHALALASQPPPPNPSLDFRPPRSHRSLEARVLEQAALCDRALPVDGYLALWAALAQREPDMTYQRLLHMGYPAEESQVPLPAGSAKGQSIARTTPMHCNHHLFP